MIYDASSKALLPEFLGYEQIEDDDDDWSLT
jgi:hypothetical protein